jgi:radical SAM superfamily enzyme YgiQ (UPF0313 family)
MRVTFIRPSITGTRSHDAMEPLVFAILAARTPRDVELDCFDERVEPVPLDHDTDLVALTVETYTARRAYQIASAFRRRGVPVVMGGYHPSFVPEEALRYADAIVVGDGENSWEQILRDAAAGALQRVYRQPALPALDGLTFDRGIFRGKRYKPVVPVQYGRGCRFACDFCSIHALYGTSLRQRPVAEVADEIEALGRKFVLIIDDNLFVDAERAEALFRALVPLKIRWGCQVSIDVAANDRLMDLMRQSGCIGALVGFESLDEVNLAQMKKWWNLKHGDYETSIRRFHDRGIMIYGSFVFGYDHDTRDVFDTTVEFALRAKLFLVNFSALTPTPGTKLYERLRIEGRLIRDPWWLDPEYRYGQATYHPGAMTPNELTDGCIRARRQFYRYSSMARRALARANRGSASRLAIFLGANLISRRELGRKIGQRLGSNAPLEGALEAF